MTPLFLTLLLQAAPTVELGERSDCAEELREAFRDSEYALQPDGEVELTLVHAPKNELTARRDGVVALRRELGAGTCGEASRAAVVIVGRWLTSLPASTWKGPRKKSRDAGADSGGSGADARDARADGGATDVRNTGSDGSSDARADADARNKRADGGTSGARAGTDTRSPRADGGAADARSIGGSARADTRNSRGDAGATDARNPGTDASSGGSSDARAGANARNPGTGGSSDVRAGADARNAGADARDAGLSFDGRPGAGARNAGDARDAGGSSEGRASDARAGTDARNTRPDGGVADSSDTRAGADARNARADGGISDMRDTTGTDPRADARNSRAADGGASDARTGNTTLSGIELTSTGGGLSGDAGVSLNSRLTLTTADAGNEAEPVIGRIGIEPPTSAPPPPPAQTTPFRVEVTHLEALAGGGIGLPGTPDPVSSLITLELALTFNRHLRVGALGAFDFGGGTNVLDERSQVRGRLSTFGFVAAPSITACLDTAIRLCGGALLGARVVQGTSSGSFIFGSENQRAAWSAAFTVGPTVQATLIAARFHLALDASLLFTPTPPQFQVMGLPTVLSWPVAQGLIRLSIGVGSL